MRNENFIETESILQLKYKLEIIKEEFLYITVRKIIDKDDIEYINLDGALEFSEITNATNGNIILYIISVPTVGNQICKPVGIKA